MKNIKVKLIKRHPFAITLFIVETIICSIISSVLIVAKEFKISPVFFVIITIMYFACFRSDAYGIKIKNNVIIFKVAYERKKYLIEDIKNIEVKFIKMNKYYKVIARVHFVNTYNKKEFEWDKIYLNRLGCVETKINDDNINEYVSLFKSLDKFYVYHVK